MTYQKIRELGAEIAAPYVRYPDEGWEEISLDDARGRLAIAERNLATAKTKTVRDKAQLQALGLTSVVSKAGDTGKIFEAQTDAGMPLSGLSPMDEPDGAWVRARVWVPKEWIVTPQEQ